VTILTLGFGDLTPYNDLGRGLVFPYSVGGIIMLGLVISSLSKFAAEMSEENVVRKHADKIRTRTLERTTSDPLEIERLQILQNFQGAHMTPISSPFHARRFHRQSNHKHSTLADNQASSASMRSSQRRASVIPAVHKRMNLREAVKLRSKKIKLLRHERDRFNEMRRIQHSTAQFKRWWALGLSVLAFATLWLVGAVIFWQTELPGQGWRYFDGLYFCYVALLTIGYGDFAPKSNAGRAFFVVWSLIAVPTMTLLISDMSTTVIESFKRGTFIAADFTILPKANIWTEFVNAHPRIKGWLVQRKAEKARKKRLKEGMQVGGVLAEADPEKNSTDNLANADPAMRPSIDTIAREVTQDASHPPNPARMARRLAVAIRSVAADLRASTERQYSFEEWAELTRLIRFTGDSMDKAVNEEEEDVIEWDWLGEDSPMMTHQSEPEFVLDRLCESLVRYTRRVEKRAVWAKRALGKAKKERERSRSAGESEGGGDAEDKNAEGNNDRALVVHRLRDDSDEE
jgi:potassium channel subfamily K, other eukaryote